MNIKKDKDFYKVESSRKGKWYRVDPKKPWCDCADFRFREMKRKGVCKHIKAVREYAEKTQQETIQEAAGEAGRTGEVIKFIESQGGEADSVELIKRFGEDEVDEMIRQGELVERRGKITILK